MAALAVASGSVGVLGGAALFGVGFGSVQPALMALTTDRVGPEERGKAMGTFYFAWELGIALGSAASGWLLNYIGFSPLFALITAPPLIGAALGLKSRRAQGGAGV